MDKGKPPWWDEAVEFLKQDELLGEVVKKYPDGSLEGKGELFETTIRSIAVSYTHLTLPTILLV